MADCYKYKPLLGRQKIRLFAFRRSPTSFSGRLRSFIKRKSSNASRSRDVKRNNQLVGTLCTIRLDNPNHPPYVALSYTWESPIPVSPLENVLSSQCWLLCDGKPLKIQRNLYDGLQTLQKCNFEGWLWIDALCIDQSNGAERNEQVGIMGNVYAEAANVMVWLGPHDAASRIALPLMARFTRKILDISYNRSRREQFRFNDPQLYSLLGMSPLDLDQWRALVNFFTRTWFQRLWVAQEIALSRGTHVLCGDTEFYLSTIIRFVDWIEILRWGDPLDRMREDSKIHYSSGIRSFSSLMQMVHRFRPKNGAEFPGDLAKWEVKEMFGAEAPAEKISGMLGLIITQSQHRLCSDPRDKIYAPLALLKRLLYISSVESGNGRLPLADYSQSVEDIFLQTSKYLILNCPKLGLLSMVDRQHLNQDYNLPSWVPDFSRLRYNSSIVFMRHNATKGWNGSAVSVNGPLLRVKGLFFDEVLAATKILEGDGDIIPLFNLSSKLHEENFLNQTGLEVLMRTLLQNSFIEPWQKMGTNYADSVKIPYSTVADSFKDWIQSRLVTLLLKKSSPSIFDLPTEILNLSGTSPIFPSHYELDSRLKSWSNLIKSVQTGRTERIDITHSQSLFHHLISRHITRRTLIRTGRSFLGLGPYLAREGDQVWFLQGASVPFLLRKLDNGNYELMGEAYIHGYMQGEIFTLRRLKIEDAELLTIQ